MPEPHTCDEFTRWQAMRLQAEDDEGPALAVWQERRCTACGRIEQLPLTFDAVRAEGERDTHPAIQAAEGGADEDDDEGGVTRVRAPRVH